MRFSNDAEESAPASSPLALSPLAFLSESLSTSRSGGMGSLGKERSTMEVFQVGRSGD